MNKFARVSALSALVLGAAVMATSAHADLRHELNYVEGGYQSYDFNHFDSADGGFIRGSHYIKDNFSVFAMGESGSFDAGAEHNMYGLGFALSQDANFGYWQGSIMVASESFGPTKDKWGRVEYGAHGRSKRGFGWDAALLYDFKSDLADRKGGVKLGVRYAFSPTFDVTLGGEKFSDDTRLELGVAWHY